MHEQTEAEIDEILNHVNALNIKCYGEGAALDFAFVKGVLRELARDPFPEYKSYYGQKLSEEFYYMGIPYWVLRRLHQLASQ